VLRTELGDPDDRTVQHTQSTADCGVVYIASCQLASTGKLKK
jgi:hypothetical protein